MTIEERNARKAMNAARRSASDTFARDGQVDDRATVETLHGSLDILAPNLLSSEDGYALIIRAYAAAEGATRVTLIAEAWQSSQGWKGRPSLDPNRTEVLVVVTETDADWAVGYAPISRGLEPQIGALGEIKYTAAPPTLLTRLSGMVPAASGYTREDGRSLLEGLGLACLISANDVGSPNAAADQAA